MTFNRINNGSSPLGLKESSFIGKKGWAVNSIVFAFKSSNLLSPILLA